MDGLNIFLLTNDIQWHFAFRIGHFIVTAPNSISFAAYAPITRYLALLTAFQYAVQIYYEVD
jgi:hypothetical protein